MSVNKHIRPCPWVKNFMVWKCWDFQKWLKVELHHHAVLRAEKCADEFLDDHFTHKCWVTERSGAKLEGVCSRTRTLVYWVFPLLPGGSKSLPWLRQTDQHPSKCNVAQRKMGRWGLCKFKPYFCCLAAVWMESKLFWLNAIVISTLQDCSKKKKYTWCMW